MIVACTAFTQHYGIDTSVSRRYVPYVEDGILCFDLKGESVEVIGNRAGSHRDDEQVLEALSSSRGLETGASGGHLHAFVDESIRREYLI